MDFFDQIELIKKILEKNGYINLANQIYEAQISGGTGGEVLLIVCSNLMAIKRENAKIYELIKNESESLVEYAQSIGLEPI